MGSALLSWWSRSGCLLALWATVFLIAPAAHAKYTHHPTKSARSAKVVTVHHHRVIWPVAHKRLRGKHLATRRIALHRSVRVASLAPVRQASFGRVFGLHAQTDPLDLNSSVALVLDQNSNEVLFEKNIDAVLPIASLTKLMTALVVLQSKADFNEVLAISAEDVDTEKGSRSRLDIGAELTRAEMLHLALMSSENRAAHALARYVPGGVDAFVARMNQQAQALGMLSTHYADPTGLSSQNQSSARDLALLVKAAYAYPLIRELSTSPAYQLWVGQRSVEFHNTNSLIHDPEWSIGLQKTGYTSEAGRCLVMQAQVGARHLIMVFLDANGRAARLGDAQRVRKWLEQASAVSLAQGSTVNFDPIAAKK